MEDLDLMKWEVEKANKSFNIKYRLGIWAKRSFEVNDEAADIHLERVKGKKSAPQAVNTQEEQAIAAKPLLPSAPRTTKSWSRRLPSARLVPCLTKNISDRKMRRNHEDNDKKGTGLHGRR